MECVKPNRFGNRLSGGVSSVWFHVPHPHLAPSDFWTLLRAALRSRFSRKAQPSWRPGKASVG